MSVAAATVNARALSYTAAEKILNAIEDDHLRRRCGVLLSAQADLSHARAEALLVGEAANKECDDHFVGEPETRRVVRGILGKPNRSAHSFHACAEVLDPAILDYVNLSTSMVRMLNEQMRADALLAAQALAKAKAEAEAQRKRADEMLATERERARAEREMMQRALEWERREGKVPPRVLAAEIDDLEAQATSKQRDYELELALLKEGMARQMKQLASDHARQLEEAVAEARREREAKERLQRQLEEAERLRARQVAALEEDARNVREAKAKLEQQMGMTSALCKRTVEEEQARSARRLEALAASKDEVIDIVSSEVKRLRRVQEEVLVAQGQSPSVARQLLFFEALKHRALPSSTLTWRGQEAEPTVDGPHSARAREKRALAAAMPPAAGDIDPARPEEVGSSGGRPTPPKEPRRAAPRTDVSSGCEAGDRDPGASPRRSRAAAAAASTMAAEAAVAAAATATSALVSAGGRVVHEQPAGHKAATPSPRSILHGWPEAAVPERPASARRPAEKSPRGGPTRAGPPLNRPASAATNIRYEKPPSPRRRAQQRASRGPA